MGSEDFIRRHIRQSIHVKEQLLDDVHVRLVAQVADEIVGAFRRENKVLLFGNGGSAADSQHIAAEFVGKYRLDRRALPAVALTSNTSSLTAIGNDYTFELVFARQLEAIGKPGDIAIGISTSGRSRNVLSALELAKVSGMTTIGLTGRGGGHMGSVVDYCIRVPSDDTPSIQEAHILIGHVLCDLVETLMFGS